MAFFYNCPVLQNNKFYGSVFLTDRLLDFSPGGQILFAGKAAANK